jgi:hypothetical protein
VIAAWRQLSATVNLCGKMTRSKVAQPSQAHLPAPRELHATQVQQLVQLEVSAPPWRQHSPNLGQTMSVVCPVF